MAVSGMDTLSSRCSSPRTSSIVSPSGRSASFVMEQLGHSQVALTLNRYTHVPSALMEEAAKAMDRALGS